MVIQKIITFKSNLEGLQFNSQFVIHFTGIEESNFSATFY